MRLVRAALQLLRLDSSLLASLSVLLPTLAKTRQLTISLERAAPLLFIMMCTFILNDLDDSEKDKINHPERPLPSGQVTPSLVALLYYVSLALALLAVRFYVTSHYVAFWYYLFLTLAISYHYVVEYLPGFKSTYVAGVVSIPVIIVLAYFPHETHLYAIAAAVFAFTLGRELCMDIRDRPGDPVSFIHRFAPRKIAILAFILQGSSLLLLALQVRGRLDVIVLSVMLGVLMLSCVCWFRWARLILATALMKGVIYLGLYFLL